MRRPLLVICDLLLGATAIPGGLVVVPTLPPEWLAHSPFPNYTVPAVALTLVGAAALAGALGLLARPRLGAAVSFLAGGAIAVFEIVEATAVNLGDWLAFLGLAAGSRMTVASQYASLALTLQVFYLLLGIAMMALAWAIWRTASATPGVAAAPVPAAVRPSAARLPVRQPMRQAASRSLNTLNVAPSSSIWRPSQHVSLHERKR